jgi:hypothetical protein
VMFVHHVPVTKISALDSEAASIVHRRGFQRGSLRRTRGACCVHVIPVKK